MNKIHSSKNTEKLYESDEYVNRYHSKPGRRLLNIVNYIEFSKQDVVIDYACGNGLLLDLIHNKIKSYTGIDTSQKFIRIASQRQKENKINNAQYIFTDIVSFSKTAKSKFTKAFALDFVEHINDKEFVKIFPAIKKTLAPNGQLIIHSPNKDYFLEILKKKGILKQTSGHITVRNSTECKTLLNKIGFKKVQIIYLNHYNRFLRPFSVLKSFPILGKFFKARLLVLCTKG